MSHASPYTSLSPSSRKPVWAQIGRACFTLYLCSALLYTAWSILLQPAIVPLFKSQDISLKAKPGRVSQRAGGSQQVAGQRRSAQYAYDPQIPLQQVAWKDYGRVHGVEWDKDIIDWDENAGTSSSSLSMGNDTALPMSEDFFLSKAFGESLQPSKVLPYYYKASAPLESNDITITTLVTANRFQVLSRLADKYQGPISVTIHITNDAKTRSDLLRSLHSLYTSSPSMSAYVDVHLVVDDFDRQFNMWRNVAKYFSRTDYIMMLDVDFALCTDFRKRMLGSPEVMNKLSEGSAAFVVPAFEYTKQADGIDTSTFPKNKEELLELVKESKIGMFHSTWNPGHGATNYTRYYAAKPTEVYKVNTYTHGYEPYVIFKKEGTPYCDERFIGYGANKAACLFELYLSGVSFYVLPDDFLIHQSHEYAEAARRNERRYNRKLYLDFREELCFRYLNHFIEDGKLNTPASRNLFVECKKIKGFAGAASRLVTAST